ncbi:unnamed protein product [Owenia fusiformis]|uniref:Uncharacterized protein n=1 Tax=Owenia fusiformis TaxID=6347 RepID=A0A8J1TBG1_OWEFU|nr:unnamed protein product [Owenia fusiformis]
MNMTRHTRLLGDLQPSRIDRKIVIQSDRASMGTIIKAREVLWNRVPRKLARTIKDPEMEYRRYVAMQTKRQSVHDKEPIQNLHRRHGIKRAIPMETLFEHAPKDRDVNSNTLSFNDMKTKSHPYSMGKTLSRPLQGGPNSQNATTNLPWKSLPAHERNHKERDNMLDVSLNDIISVKYSRYYDWDDRSKTKPKQNEPFFGSEINKLSAQWKDRMPRNKQRKCAKRSTGKLCRITENIP